MMSRSLAMIGWTTLAIGLGCSPNLALTLDEPPAPQQKPSAKPSAKAQVKEALAVADEDLPRAISILERGLQAAPEDREALFLLGVLTTVHGEQVKDRAERIRLFHKSYATFARLKGLYKNPTPNEKAFNARNLVNEARARSLEGKVKESFEAIKEARAAGFDDLGSIESEPDFEAVRKLPELATLIQSDHKAQVDEARKEVAEEMSKATSFPFDFELKDTDEKTVTLADYKGKVTIVDVWGTWCPPCRREIPHFVALYKQFKDKGLEIVGINCNEEGSRDEVKKKIKDFAREYKIEYRCLLNDDNTEAKIPGFRGYPTTLFLDRTGKVRLMVVGETPRPRLEAIIATLLEDSSRADEAKGK
jgi:thiol-disulfide isomerase/thioredoxin